MSPTLILIRKEIRDGLRNRWVLAVTLLLAMLALSLGFLGSAPTGTVKVDPLTVTVGAVADFGRGEPAAAGRTDRVAHRPDEPAAGSTVVDLCCCWCGERAYGERGGSCGRQDTAKTSLLLHNPSLRVIADSPVMMTAAAYTPVTRLRLPAGARSLGTSRRGLRSAPIPTTGSHPCSKLSARRVAGRRRR